MNKKAQLWGFDLIIAMTIFSIGIVLFYIYSLNSPEREARDAMEYDGNLILDSILSEGYPADWDSESVLNIGITSEDKINNSKLEMFYFLAKNEYERTKQMFNTKFNYLFFLSDEIIIDSESIPGIGKPGSEPNSIISDNLIKITGFSIYEDKPVTAYLYIWR